MTSLWTSQVCWQLIATATFAWCTWSLVQSVLWGRRLRHPSPRLHRFHHSFMQPFGAVLAFGFALLTLGSGWAFVQLLLSDHTT